MMTLSERAQALAGIYQQLDATRRNEPHTVYRLATLGREARELVQEWPEADWPAFSQAPQGPALTKQWVLDGLQEGLAEAKGYRYTESGAGWMDVLRPIYGVLEIFCHLLYRSPGR